MILDRDRSQMLARGSVLIHVPSRDHREQRRESGARPHFAAKIARARKNLRHLGRRLRSHLLNAADQHDIIKSRRNRRNSVEECRSAGRARRFEASSRNSADAQAAGDVRRQMILPDKRRPGEISEIERLDLRRLGAAVLQRFLAGLHRERTEIAIRERRQTRSSRCRRQQLVSSLPEYRDYNREAPSCMAMLTD